MLQHASDGEISRFLYFLQEKILEMEISGVSEVLVGGRKIMKYTTCKKVYDVVETEVYRRFSLNDFNYNNTVDSFDCEYFLRCCEFYENLNN
jgi:hypothetical protein